MNEPDRALKSKANKWGRAAGHVDVSVGVFYNPYFSREAPPSLRVALFRDYITKGDSERAQKARASLPRLRGKVLVCTCPRDQPCHADVLLELANPVETATERAESL